MRLIPGDELTTAMRQQVLRAFVHRHLSGLSDDDWTDWLALAIGNSPSRTTAPRGRSRRCRRCCWRSSVGR
jgi:hypothetical protein